MPDLLTDVESEVQRWTTYQRERFPLLAHGPLIAAFTSAALCVSALLRDPVGGATASAPSGRAFIAAFVSGLLFFLQLRISDEFKDVRDDVRHRPYRPVPRKLVTLRELRALGLGAALAQAALAAWVDPRMLPLLAIVWVWLLLMRRNFFMGAWLHDRPVAVLVSHMVIVPLIDLYATAFDWLPRAAPPSPGLWWFALASFGNGVVVEVGRKLRAPADEEAGVDTYSARWGRPRALAVFIGAMAVTLLCAWQVAVAVGIAWLAPAAIGVVIGLTMLAGMRFLRVGAPRSGRWFEWLSGVHTLAVYAGCGIVPWLMRRAAA
ncbi:MAG: UbiA family prenyltransferase [Gemmatimonadaceae bacterium]|nr:UbiA family prenyltransferase [Gemmatimonadaceae bacterium]